MTRFPSFSAVLTAIGMLLLPRPSDLSAQGTKADYDRAFALAQTTAGKVFRDRVEPVWQPDGKQFWYRNQIGPRQWEFVWVDAEKGQRRRAFDHEKLAQALSMALKRTVPAMELPVRQLISETGADGMFFQAEGQWFCFRPDKDAAAALEKVDKPPQESLPEPSEVSVQPSRKTGEETHITFVNEGAAPLQLYWVDPQGQWKNYGGIAPREEHDQHTFAGHIWLLATPEGHVVGAYEAPGSPSRIVIGKEKSAPPPPGDARGPSRPRLGKPPAAAPAKRRWTAEIRDHNIWATDQESEARESFPLTTDGTAANHYREPFFWSPDGTHLAAMKVEEGDDRKVSLVESSPRGAVQPSLRTVSYPKPGDKIDHPRLALLDLTNRRQIPVAEDLFPTPWSLTEVRWSRDSSRFTALYNQRGHQILRLLAVDAATGAVRTLVEESSPTFIDYTNKVWHEILEDSQELLWMSESRTGWNHLYRFDLATGALKNALTSGEWAVEKVERVDREARQVWFSAMGVRPGQDPYHLHLCRVNFDGSGMTILTEGDGTHRWEITAGGRYFLDRWSRVDQPTVTELRRTSDGSLVCELERGDATALLAGGWRMPERFTAKGRDGKTDIWGIIVRPSNFDPAKKYPVIEKIYAGPQGHFVPKSFGLAVRDRMIAELGFILVQIDGMGTNGRSKAFHDVCWKNLADAGFPDRIAWLKSAAEKHPEMDLGRVGIYGGSAGGQNAMRALIDHGDFYKVAVADCGCHDNRMDKIWWNEQWMGWPVGPEYERSSNVAQAHKLQGKLLLTWGELDNNVDPASSMQVVNALIKAGKQFDMLIVPGEGHGVGELPYAARRRMDFFVRHLIGREPE